jgi:hypothetical protein
LSLKNGFLFLELAREGVHYGILTKLGPHKVDLLNLLFVVKKPPEPRLEQCPYENRIVALANITLVLMKWLIQRDNRILEGFIIRHILRLIFVVDHPTQVANQLLNQNVRYLSTLYETVVEHGLGNRYSYFPAKLHHFINIDLSLIFKAKSDKVVVVVQHNIDSVGFMVSVIKRRDYLNLCRRIFLGIWILQN